MLTQLGQNYHSTVAVG